MSVEAIRFRTSNDSVLRKFPPISDSDPGKSFLDLIRAGKFQDSDTEYGAKTVVREYLSIPMALARGCTTPSFANQNVGERYIEWLLSDVDNSQRFVMARQISLVFRDQNMETPFSKMAEAIAMTQSGNDDADGEIESLLRLNGIQKFVQQLIDEYSSSRETAVKPAMKATLLDLFSNLQANMTRIQGSPRIPAGANTTPLTQANLGKHERGAGGAGSLSSIYASTESSFVDVGDTAVVDPASRLFTLIRYGRFEASNTEFGKKNIGSNQAVSAALAKVCENPLFDGQTVGEVFMELFLNEITNPRRFDGASQMCSVLKTFGMETQFSRMVEAIVAIQAGSGDKKGKIQALLNEDGAEAFVQQLIDTYRASRKDGMLDVFLNLQTNMKVAKGGIGSLGSSWGGSSYSEVAPTSSFVEVGAGGDPFDALANVDNRV